MKLVRDAKRFAFELDSFTLLDDKALAAHKEKYKPKEGLNFIGFTFHATTPVVNMKAMAITPPTMVASLDSAINMAVNFEHRIDDIARIVDMPGNMEDFKADIMGHIVELNMGEVPDHSDEAAWSLSPFIPTEPIITTGVMALYTRVFKIARIADEVSRGTSWFFSLEIGENTTEPAIWLAANDELPDEIIPWGEASEELRQVASQPKMMEHEGRAVAYLMGGADGIIPFVGGAITGNPAGFEQRQPGRQLKLIASADGAIRDGLIDKIWQSKKWKEHIQGSLKNRKEASVDRDEVGFSPILINDLVELIEVTDTVTELVDNNDSGGESKVAKIEIEEDELAKRVADAKLAGSAEGRAEGKTEGDTEGYDRGMTEGAVAGVAKAVEDGTHIAADAVDGIVEKRMMSQTRETKVASLTCDDETKADFLTLASNEKSYPLDVEGEEKFSKAYTRWEASLKTASDEGEGEGEGEGSEDGVKKKKSASDEDAKKKKLDLGSGGGGSDGKSLDDLLAMTA